MVHGDDLLNLHFQPGVDQHISMYASPTARRFYFPGPFNFICSKTSLRFPLVLGLADVGPLLGS